MSRRTPSRRPAPVRAAADGALLLVLLCALALFCLNTYLRPFYYGHIAVSFIPPGAMSPIPLPPALGTCAGAGLVSLLVWSLPRRRWLAALLLLLGAAALIWLNGQTLLLGALALWERLSILFTDATDFPGYFNLDAAWAALFPVEGGYIIQTFSTTAQQAAMEAFLAAAAAVYALPLGWAAVRARSFWLTFALTLPWLLPAFLAEISMDWPALMAVCAC